MYDAHWGDGVFGPAVLVAVRMGLLGMWQSLVNSQNTVYGIPWKLEKEVFSFAWERRKQNMNFPPFSVNLACILLWLS